MLYAKIRDAGGDLGIAGGDVVWPSTRLGVKKIYASSNTVRGEIRLPSTQFYYGIQLVDGSLWVSSTAGRPASTRARREPRRQAQRGPRRP